MPDFPPGGYVTPAEMTAALDALKASLSAAIPSALDAIKDNWATTQALADLAQRVDGLNATLANLQSHMKVLIDGFHEAADRIRALETSHQ